MKTTFIAVLTAFAVAGLGAQEAGDWALGARLGGSFGFNNPRNFVSWMGANPQMWLHAPGTRNTHQAELNFNFAVYGGYAITDNLSVLLELNFMINQGYEVRLYHAGLGAATRAVDYHSLDIPILFRYDFLGFGPSFGILAGPHVSFPLGRVGIYDNNAGRDIGEFAIPTAATFGLTTGVFGALPAGPGRIVGDLRFLFDFNSVEATFLGETRAFMQRRALAITVGYEIFLR